MNDSLPDWLRPRPKPFALICDIDDTLCTEFDKPVLVACRYLAGLDRLVTVHYVTARPEAARDGTERFLAEHRLPGWRNLHFCPNHLSTRQHKTEVMARLAKEYQVLVSVGDAAEDELASLAAGVPFLLVTDDNADEVWAQIAARVAADVPSAPPLFADP